VADDRRRSSPNALDRWNRLWSHGNPAGPDEELLVDACGRRLKMVKRIMIGLACAVAAAEDRTVIAFAVDRL
jgi:hypothetical protein